MSQLSLEEASAKKYTMTVSRQTVDKLGVKMYDRVSAVVAELIANSYDADSKRVEIYVPAGIWLAKKVDNHLYRDPSLSIIIKDDGIGMTVEEANEFYLKVGSERRKDIRRGDKSKIFGRSVMGRKGVGKLAPFGICENIEVITAGGDPFEIDGKIVYAVSNFILDLKGILADTDEPYFPKIGTLDGSHSETTGTTIILKTFSRRYVPTLEELDRQLSQRFGISSSDWKIEIFDNNPIAILPIDQLTAAEKITVGSFQIALMEHTKISFDAPMGTGSRDEPYNLTNAFGPNGLLEVESGFKYDGRVYPIKGWMAYAQQSYRDDLMAGVRIYCRGKIAAQTSLFGKKSGFTGEYQVRSYLVGELHADWLDEEEDLIQTDRKDILWSEEIAQQFEKWGQEIVSIIGSLSPEPIRKKVLESFMVNTSFQERLIEAFPNPNQSEIRERAEELATMFAYRMREDEAMHPSVKDTVDTVFMLAPHVTLDRQLREAALMTQTQFSVVAHILRTARIAELSSFGRIADERVRIIDRLNELKDALQVNEGELQELVDEAPWLIDPQWAPVTANQSFGTIKKRFEEFFNRKTGEQISLSGFDNRELRRKRPDFVLLEEDHAIQLVEIKKPGYAFADEDMTRLNNYFILMEEFMNDSGNQPFVMGYNGRYKVTLVCDFIKLSPIFQAAYEGRINSNRLIQMNWSAFLTRTQRVHQDFLTEASRQRLFIAPPNSPDFIEDDESHSNS